MNHVMKLAENPYYKIKSGAKAIESRLFDEKRKNINLGDTIEFCLNSNPNEKTLTEVVALLRYPLFRDLMSDFPPLQFGGESKEELLTEIHQFYSEEEEERLGVLGIKISLPIKQ
ncbi:MAG: RNA-binding protein [Patescibacteria group bacterium]|jgi:ASC-1-like (ASCH) protein|nr:RNA-binding protein [Patescibacteria group bacterium]